MIGLVFFLSFIPAIVGYIIRIVFHSSKLKHFGTALIWITVILLLLFAYFFSKGLKS